MTSPKTKKKGKKRPPKRPPPKGQVLATSRSKTLIELPGPDPVEMRPGFGVSKRSRRNYLRSRAGSIFVVDPSMPTIDDIASSPEFSEVPNSTLRNWAQEDAWEERRREFIESINARVRQRIGNELVQQQIRILKDCDTIYEKNMEIFTGQSGFDMPPPKSYESFLRAHTTFIRAISEMGRDVIDVVVPPTVPQGEPVDEVSRVLPELSTEEARIAALAIVQQRRQLRSKNNDEDEDDGETLD